MRKRLLVVTLVAVAGMLLLPAVGSAELLNNADFESNTGWLFWRQGTGITDTYTTVRNLTAGGSQSVKCPGDPATANDPQIVQDVVSGFAVGEMYTASVHAYCEVGWYPQFIVGFLDSSDTWFAGSGWQNIENGYHQWGSNSVSGTIPAGTAKIRFVMAGSASDTTYFDDASLTATPEPGALVLLSTGLIGLLAYAWRKRR